MPLLFVLVVKVIWIYLAFKKYFLDLGITFWRLTKYFRPWGQFFVSEKNNFMDFLDSLKIFGLFDKSIFVEKAFNFRRIPQALK